MKTLSIVVAVCLALSACAKAKVIDGKKYEPYGFATMEREDQAIKYEPSFASVVLAIICFETVIAPIYVAGWNLFEPVGKKPIPALQPTNGRGA